MTLRVPQFRDGSFPTEIFQRYQRSEQALVLALMEMVVNGVSTRKVSKITEELCGTSFSKSTVSRLCAALFSGSGLAEVPGALRTQRALTHALAAQGSAGRGAGLIEEMEQKAPRAVTCLEEGVEDALAVLVLPEKYRRRLKSTNMQERLIQEIRRCERVIRVFPNEESAHRLIGALVAEIHEEWQGRRYLDMSDFHEWWEAQGLASQEVEKLVSIDH